MDPQTPTPVTPQKNNSKLFIIILSVVLILLLIGIVVLFVTTNNTTKQKNSTISDQQSKIAIQQTEIMELKQGIDETKLTIPELGLQYPKTVDSLNTVFIVDTNDKSRTGLYMTSKSLMSAQLNASRLVPPPQKNACGAAESPAGTITIYKSDDTINGQKVTDFKNPDLRKIGDKYYYYQASPTVCSLNSDVQNEQKKATEQARSFFKSLELKKE